MNHRRNPLLLVLLVTLISTVIYAAPMSPKPNRIRSNAIRPVKPVPNNRQLMQTTRLVLRSARTVEKVESLLISLHDLARASATGSYSAFQRSEMNIELQDTLTQLDPMIEKATYNGLNMLDSEDEIITLDLRGTTLEFACVDITSAGLGLDIPFDISNPTNASQAWLCLEAAVRRIKEVNLQFTDYINTLSNYTYHVKPILGKETQMALEIVEASKEYAESITARFNRALDLIEQVQTGTYSPQQLLIMNIEFEEMLLGYSLGHIYYGLGIIDSTDILVVDTGRGMLEFQCIDLTQAALGLDVGLSITTPEAAQNASTCVTSALQTVEEAIITLDEYIATLTEYLQPETHRPLRIKQAVRCLNKR